MVFHTYGYVARALVLAHWFYPLGGSFMARLHLGPLDGETRWDSWKQAWLALP